MLLSEVTLDCCLIFLSKHFRTCRKFIAMCVIPEAIFNMKKKSLHYIQIRNMIELRGTDESGKEIYSLLKASQSVD